MNVRIYFLLITIAFWGNCLSAQRDSLSFRVLDAATKLPIENVHVFLTNSTFGTFTDKDGICEMGLPLSVPNDLIVSHVNYLPLTLSPSEFNSLNLGDTLLISPSGLNIDNIIVSSKRSKKWKKNFNKFKEAFLGRNNPSSKCEIINPEALRFNSGKSFTANAVDLLQLKNSYLGYDIDFLLKNLTIDSDGSVVYLGNAKFTDKIDDYNTKKIAKNRKKAFERSPRHFYLSLINNSLNEDGYVIKEISYKNGIFSLIRNLTRDSVISYDQHTGLYALNFNEFLEITNTRHKSIVSTGLANVANSIESSKFGNTGDVSREEIKYAKSLLYKNSKNVYLNRHGHVINKKSVKEYGDWAEQKMAATLPLDYGIDYSEEITIRESNGLDLTQIEKFNLLKELIYNSAQEYAQTIQYLKNNWSKEYLPALYEILRLSGDESLISEIQNLLQDKVGKTNKTFYQGVQNLWKDSVSYEDFYFDFKGEIYQHIDPKFKKYFASRQNQSLIRLDEVMWGGVEQDGIPPLRYPDMIAANSAEYLNPKDIVFGIVIDGEARAYPKRILAWHEFFVDSFGATEIAGVYCTLCGTVIPYDTQINGTRYDLGTSGFLYRSNKLMYDKATQSLWSTIDGKPVIGPLVNQNLQLTPYPVITTTWKEWLKAYPHSKVLSTNTGHNRDYREGIAYQDYFSTDELMFPVPLQDDRLNNKDEVFVIRTNEYATDPLAISLSYLNKKKIHQDSIGGENLVVISENVGTAKAYYTESVKFLKIKNGFLIDKEGTQWTIQDDFLINNNNRKLSRIPGHNIFWFAWVNRHPNTRIKY